jgi:Winged helix DNA-binding domain
MEATAREVRAQLAERPLRRAELEQLAGKLPSVGIGSWVELVRAPPSGTWERRRADLFAAAEDWIGPPTGSESEGVELLVRRYLGAFGPSRPADIASWAGLAISPIAVALSQMQLRSFRSESGDELVDLPDAPLPDADTPAPVRFLPTWDATLLVHARGTGVLPEEHRPRIFSSKNPASESTFLVDGVVAGVWKYVGGGVRVEPFGRLDAAVRRELAEESERLAALHL